MLRLEIVTPERRVLDADVDSVTVPTATGEVGILPAHAPLISALKPGIITYTTKGSSERLAVAGGFVEVTGDKVSVLADTAESADEIDVAAAREQRDAAERTFAAASAATVEETEALREQVEAAAVRFQLASGK